jgi:putative peptide zinc metalloprotease protein
MQVVCHEGSHALLCQYFRVPVREMGVGLLLYFLPVAYVDRTDAYRLRSRWQRAMIALAGPASDLVWTGIYGVLVLQLSGGLLLETAHALLFFNLFLLVVNLNPILPTDGYAALEAAAGELNFRARAMAYLAHRISFTPLSSSLQGISTSRVLAYLAFVGVYLAYVALLLLSFGSALIRGILATLGRL